MNAYIFTKLLVGIICDIEEKSVIVVSDRDDSDLFFTILSNHGCDPNS